jgi:hypothetical protein
MFVALHVCRFTCNGCYSWWNNNRRFWVMLGNSVVNDLAIVRPVCSHRRNVSTDLIKEVWQLRDVADIIRRQFHRHDFMRIGIDTQMQLAPTPTRSDAVFLIEPFALAVNLQASAIDQTSCPFPARGNPGKEARPGLRPGPAKGRALGASPMMFAASV